MPTDLDTWRTVALSSAALGQTCFTLLYFTFPWYKTFLGRALFYKALTLCVFTDFVWTARTFHFSDSDTLFVGVYSALAAGIWFQFAAFLRVKRVGKNYDGPDRRQTQSPF